MSSKTSIQQERKVIFKDFISFIISEYRNQLVENNCSDLFISKLLRNKKNTKLNSHLKIIKNIVDSFTEKLAPDIKDEIIIGFVIEYFNNSNKKVILSSNFLNGALKKLIAFLENDTKYFTYFSPLHNFKSNLESININKSTKIRRVTNTEKQKMKEVHQGVSNIIANLEKISHILVVQIEKKGRNQQPKIEANQEILNVCNILKVFKEGSIKTGGLFAFNLSENWNPRKNISRIDFEPLETYSVNKFLFDDNIQFRKFYEKLGNCFPHVNDRTFTYSFSFIII